MSEMLDRMVEGNRIITSGSLVCPSPDVCDVRKGERFESYVERHAYDHNLDLSYSEDAVRNLGLNCFYFDHKYIYGNPTLTPYPFWEIHSFIAEDEWNEDDLEERVPIPNKTFRRIPDAANRRPGDSRSMKQVELPRQCEKTSIGARAYSIFISKREYFVNNTRNYPIMIRSATALNSRDSLRKIFLRATTSARIKRLYGVNRIRCQKCGEKTHLALAAPKACGACGETKKIASRIISLVDPTPGSGGTGKDSITFRWAIDTSPVDSGIFAVAADPFGDVDDEESDDDATYSVRAVGLKTEMTGQRPRLYQLDDIQTEDNSDTPDKRARIIQRFDEAVRQVEFGGRVIVYDTRKYVSDFAGAISVEPLRSKFHTLHRRARWKTKEPDNPPYVVDGFRYYYPVNGKGKPTLDKRQLDDYERQMVERSYSAEYNNDPLDPSKVLFKREYFRVILPEDAPPEIRFGLGRPLFPNEEQELIALGVRIHALNACDPASKEQQSRRGDDTFIVGIRTAPRFQMVCVTYLAAGHWTASKTWDEIERANNYNRPEYTDYEMPADEKHVRPSFEKWCRERSEQASDGAKAAPLYIPMHWSHMPKSKKTSRIEHCEPLMKNGGFCILANAGPADLIEKYINQWVALGVTDHDDGPDATARLITRIQAETWARPAPEPEEPSVTVTDGAAHIPMSLINQLATPEQPKGLWGELGW